MWWAHRWCLRWIKSVKTPFFFFFFWGGGGSKAKYSGNALFLFFITREEEGGSGVQDGCPLAQVTIWMMCMERCLAQLSTLHSKNPFFKPRESHPLARTPLPSKKTPKPLLPPHCCRPPAPSCLLPLAELQVLHVAVTGAGWRWPPPLSSEDTCFPVGWGCVGVGRLEQRGGGVQRMGGLEMPLGRSGNKRTRALSHALFGERLYAPVER